MILAASRLTSQVFRGLRSLFYLQKPTERKFGPSLAAITQGVSPSETPFLPMERLRERTIFAEIRSFTAFAEKKRISHAVFGGLGTAAYLGHLPFRLVKDLDLVVSRHRLSQVDRYFHKAGFSLQSTEMSQKANFRRFVKRTPSLEVMVQVFPETFTFIDLAHPEMHPFWTYDFGPALTKSQKHEIVNLDSTESITIRAVPLEDLVISKLWPFFESNMFYDLILLLPLLTDRSLFKPEYYLSRLGQSSALMKAQCLDNAHTFIHTLNETETFSRLFDDDAKHTALDFFDRLTDACEVRPHLEVATG